MHFRVSRRSIEPTGIYHSYFQLLITGPDQLISVTVIRKDPLFAMEFDYELNGNIEEARWGGARARAQA
ncbi:MAG: hypothetical protein IPN33_18575 [Saprospiraceae bacterium]|nr:hypothetical protein [Saprospiraceae bacterium]